MNTPRSSAPGLWIFCTLAVLLSLIAPMGLSSPSQAQTSVEPNRFVSVPYQRLFTTATAAPSPLAPDETRSVKIAGLAGVPSDASAVVVDVTVSSTTTTLGSIQLWTAGDARPNNAIVRFTNATAPQTNTAIVRPNSAGMASLYNTSGSTHINIDVQGYFTAGTGGAFTAHRADLLNTTTTGAVNHGGVIATQVTGSNNVPAGATAVFANVTVINPTTDGALRFANRGAAAPSAPNFNFSAGSSDTSGMVITLDANGGLATHVTTTTGGVHIYIDIQGYFTSGTQTAEGSFNLKPTAPLVFHAGGTNALQAGETRHFSVTQAEVPEYGAEAVAVTMLVYDIKQTGHIRLYGKGFTAPAIPLVAISASEPVGMAVTTVVPVGLDGSLSIQNTSPGTVQIQIRVQGWFSGYRAVTETVESQFVADAVRLGTPENVAKLAVWHEDLADTLPQDVTATVEPAEPVDDFTMTEDGAEGTEASPSTPADPLHEQTINDIPEDTPASAEDGKCARGYKLRSITERVTIESKVNVDLYWMQLKKRWCARHNINRIGSVWSQQSADVTAAADPFIDDEGTISDGAEDTYLPAVRGYGRSAHYTVRVRRFKFCAAKVAFCYDTEFAQWANVFSNYNAYSGTAKY